MVISEAKLVSAARTTDLRRSERLVEAKAGLHGANHGPAVTLDVGEGGVEGVDGHEVVQQLQAAVGSGVVRG